MWMIAGLISSAFIYVWLGGVFAKTVIRIVVKLGIIKPRLIRTTKFAKFRIDHSKELEIRNYISDPQNTNNIFLEMNRHFGHLPLLMCESRSSYYLTPDDCRFVRNGAKPSTIAGYINTNRRYALDYFLSKRRYISRDGYEHGYFSFDATTTSPADLEAAECYMRRLQKNLYGRAFVKSVYQDGEIRYAWKHTPADADFMHALHESANGRDAHVLVQIPDHTSFFNG